MTLWKKYGYAFLLAIILSTLSAFIFFLLHFSHSELIAYLKSQFSLPHVQQAIGEKITINRYQMLQWILKIVALVLMVSTAMILIFRTTINASCKNSRNFIVHKFKLIVTSASLSPIQRKGLYIMLLLYSIHTLYYAATKYFDHDECWTYNYFVDGGLLGSFLAPQNNHYGFTLLSWVLHLIWPSIYAMRLIAFLFGVGSIFLFADFCKRYLQERVFFLALTLYSFSVPLLCYSVFGRSYSSTLFFAIIGLYSLMKINLSSCRKSWWWVLVISQALGLFMSVAYIYPLFGFVVASAVVARKDKELLRSYLKYWMLCAILCVLLLGIPLLLLGGWQSFVLGVSEVANKSTFYYLWKSFDIVTIYFTGWRSKNWIFLVAVLLSLCIALLTRKRLLVVCAIQLTLVPIFFALQHNVLYERLFTYLAIFVVLAIVAIFEFFRISKKYILGIGALIIPVAIFVFHNHFLMHWSVVPDEANYKLVQYLQSKKIDSCYQMFFYAAPATAYYSKQNGHPIYQELASEGSIQYVPFNATKHYQAIVSRVEDSLVFEGYTKTTIAGHLDVWE